MKKVHHNKAGFVLVSILSVITVLSLAFGAFMFSGQQQTFTTKRMINRTKALAYAEAGIDYSFAKLSADFTQRHNLGAFGINGGSINSDGAMESTYAEGSFAITLATNGNRYCVVTSVGKCGGQEVTAEILAEDYNADTGGSTPPIDYTGMEGLEYGIISGGDFTANGNVGIDTSGGSIKLHSNSKLTSAKNLESDQNLIKTAKSFGKKSSGTIEKRTIPIPDIDTGPWEAIGHKININPKNKLSEISIPAGTKVLIVEGLGTFVIDQDIEATIIVLDANVDVKANLTPGIGNLGLVTKGSYDEGTGVEGGNIKLHGNRNRIIQGITYTTHGNFNMVGTPRVKGQLLINGTTDIRGTSDAFLFVKNALVPPGTDGTTTPYVQDVRIGAWQK